MSWQTFAIIFVSCALSMLICRVVPLFLLKGRELPKSVTEALGYIPPAAFAALVANDLFKPGILEADIWSAVFPFVASALVLLVGWKTKSLIWCVIAGVSSFALLSQLSVLLSL